MRAEGHVSETILMQSYWTQTRLRATVEAITPAAVTLDGKTAAVAPLKPKINPSGQYDQQATDSQTTAYDTLHHRASPEQALSPEPSNQPPIAPLRFGVEFKDVSQLSEGQRIYSQPFFMGGCWWTAFLQRFESASAGGKEKWGLFLRRSEGKALTQVARITDAPGEGEASTARVTDPFTRWPVKRSISYYVDRRHKVRAMFRLFNAGVKSYEPVFTSRPNDYGENESWGYRSRECVVSARDLELSKFESGRCVRLTLILSML